MEPSAQEPHVCRDKGGRTATPAPESSRSQQPYSRLDTAILSFVSIAFLSLSLYQISLPGLYGDELDKLVPTVGLLTGRSPLYAGWSVTVFGFRILLSFTDRIGSVLSYLPMPFILLFGYTPLALRLSAALCGLLTIIFAYLGARLWCGPWMARIGILLVSVSPVFVFLQRMGYYNYGPVTLFTSITFLFLARYKVRAKPADLLLSAVFAGIAINTALQAVFVLIPMAILALCFHRPTKPRIRGYLFAAAVFFVVSSPVLYTGLRTGAMLNRIGWRESPGESPGLSVSQFWDTVKTHYSTLMDMIGGTDGVQVGSIGRDIRNAWMEPALLLSIGLLVIALALSKSKRDFLFREGTPLLIASTGLFLSGFILNEGRITYQLIVLWPFVVLVIGSALGHVYERFRRLRLVTICLVCALVVTQARATVEIHRRLSETGGRNYTSSQVYPLVSYLKGLHKVNVIAMEWGLRGQVYYLSGGTIMPEALHGWWPKEGPSPPGFKLAMLRTLQDPASVYVFWGPGQGLFDRYAEFERVAQAANKVVVVEKNFYERDSSIAYRVVRVLDSGGAKGYSQ